MAAAQQSAVQLFYDIGNGYNEADSAVIKPPSSSVTSFRELSFVLPRTPIFHLRFDALTTGGSLVIRNIAIHSGSAVFYRITPSHVQPLNGSANLNAGSSEITVTPARSAVNPSIAFVFDKPLRPYTSLKGRDWPRLAAINACLALVALIILGLQKPLTSCFGLVVRYARRLDRHFQGIAGSLSSAFIEFDSLAIWVYAACFLGFAVGGVLDLNGSSEGMYSASSGHGAPVKTWIGKPRAARSDEWGYVTPDILNQYFRSDRFAAQHSTLGDHYIALTGNIPVKHVVTLFRPQFWPFFVLRADYAYGFYWQAKGLLLFGGVFTFLLWITGSSAWALVGGLWYFFAPSTQWSYSWPSALPEMIGCICLAAVFFAYLTVSRNALGLFLCAVGAVICTLDFLLCAYPPHMIPLFWLAAAALIAWFAAARKEIFVREKLLSRVVVLSLVIVVIAAISGIVYRDLKVAIDAVANTIYPGQRIIRGGSMSLWMLASHFLPWTETDNQYPPALGNISEGSGFLWLAPITLFCLPRLVLGTFQKAALTALWAFFLLLLCWLVLPLPVAFGRVFGLHLAFAARCLPALGLANVGIVAICMGALTRNRQWRRLLPVSRRDLLYLLIAFVILAFALHAVNLHIGDFFPAIDVLLAAAVAACLVGLMLTKRLASFAAVLIIPQVFLFGQVNPIERGLPVLTRSDLRRFVTNHPELLLGKWIVFSKNPVSSGFLAATGCDVYTGTRYLPDIDHFGLFASHGLDLNAFNRLGYLDARAISADQRSQFELESPVVVSWRVNPNDPILRQIGIKFFAFDKRPPDEISAGLKSISAEPVDGFWLYELPPLSHAKIDASRCPLLPDISYSERNT